MQAPVTLLGAQLNGKLFIGCFSFPVSHSLFPCTYFPSRSRVLFLGEPNPKQVFVRNHSDASAPNHGTISLIVQGNLLTITDRGKSVLFYFSLWLNTVEKWYNTKKKLGVGTSKHLGSLKTCLSVPLSVH